MSNWGASNYTGRRRGCECTCSSTAAVAVLGVTLSLSFLLLIICGSTGDGWLPMINLIAVLFLPIFSVLGGQLGGGASSAFFNEARHIWANFGACFLGLVLASMLGLPLILLHAGTLSLNAFGYWLGSTAIAVRSFCPPPGQVSLSFSSRPAPPAFAAARLWRVRAHDAKIARLLKSRAPTPSHLLSQIFPHTNRTP